MMPKKRNGSACRKSGSKWPVQMPTTPKNRPTAASEKATGKPISMKTIMPAEHQRGQHTVGE